MSGSSCIAFLSVSVTPAAAGDQESRARSRCVWPLDARFRACERIGTRKIGPKIRFFSVVKAGRQRNFAVVSGCPGFFSDQQRGVAAGQINFFTRSFAGMTAERFTDVITLTTLEQRLEKRRQAALVAGVDGR